jgi:glycosyltransferase involved in cell wall biosynthesis
VILTGHLPKQQVRAAYGSAAVTVLPSRYESFGIAALEAVAANCPVIVTESCGVAEILKSCRGAVVQTNEHALHSRLIEILTDDEARKALIAEETNINWQSVSWPEITRSLTRIYSAVLTTRAGK